MTDLDVSVPCLGQCSAVPLHMVRLFKVLPEITGNEIIISYFCDRRPDAMQATPVRGSGLAQKKTCSGAEQNLLPLLCGLTAR